MNKPQLPAAELQPLLGKAPCCVILVGKQEFFLPLAATESSTYHTEPMSLPGKQHFCFLPPRQSVLSSDERILGWEM